MVSIIGAMAVRSRRNASPTPLGEDPAAEEETEAELACPRPAIAALGGPACGTGDSLPVGFGREAGTSLAGEEVHLEVVHRSVLSAPSRPGSSRLTRTMRLKVRPRHQENPLDVAGQTFISADRRLGPVPARRSQRQPHRKKGKVNDYG